jgi:hypothetical protein
MYDVGMKVLIPVAVFVCLAGVASSSHADPAEAAPVPAVPSTAPARVLAPTPPPCDRDGSYRLRYSVEKKPPWWVRFDVKDGKAMVTDKIYPLDLKPSELSFKASEMGCGFTLEGSTRAAGAFTITVHLDPTGKLAAGTIVRAKAYNESDKQVVVAGVRDTEPPVGAACFVPGIYKLNFDRKSKWKNSDEDDDRSCRKAPKLASPLVLQVEPFGPSVAFTLRESQAPYDEESLLGKFTSTGECEVRLELSTYDTTLDATFLFSPEAFSGVATRVQYQIVIEDENGEDIWDCIGENVDISAALIREKKRKRRKRRKKR